MSTFAPLALVLVAATGYGIWYQRTRGRVKVAKTPPNTDLVPQAPAVSSAEIGTDFGSRVTLLQFSSAFCSPCRATRALLTDVVADLPDVVHVDIDAESHLDLVRKLGIHSTPTTLILDARGVEIGRAVGAPKREQVITALAGIH